MHFQTESSWQLGSLSRRKKTNIVDLGNEKFTNTLLSISQPPPLLSAPAFPKHSHHYTHFLIVNEWPIYLEVCYGQARHIENRATQERNDSKQPLARTLSMSVAEVQAAPPSPIIKESQLVDQKVGISLSVLF